MQMDRHCVVYTSIKCFAVGGRTVMGAILFLPFQRLQGDPVSCLPEPFGKQCAHPTPGKSPETCGLLPGALATWTWGSCRQEVLCVPRFGRWCFRAHWFREIRSFLLGKNKCLCIICSIEIVSDFVFFKLYLTWYTITFLGRILMCTFRPLCLARVLQTSSWCWWSGTRCWWRSGSGRSAGSCSPSPTWTRYSGTWGPWSWNRCVCLPALSVGSPALIPHSSPGFSILHFCQESSWNPLLLCT